MVFNPLIRETVHGEKVDCNVFKTQLSVTSRICILDRTIYGCYLALEGQVFAAEKKIDE